jgi:proteasome assembly chaperone (PAC2) family protein
MEKEPIQIKYIPQLEDPLFIAGFEGWGNALDISRGMVDFMIKKLDGEIFARINPDPFYRFDEIRPLVNIEDGLLKEITPPGGKFYVCNRVIAGRDIVLLKASEPHLRWFYFVDSIISLCEKLHVKTIISLGSMYDNVIHTDTVISALATNEELLKTLSESRVLRINYKGPSAIHSTLLHQAMKKGMECISLWCHCPYYLQGTTHFGLLSNLGGILSRWGGFKLDTTELEITWKELNKQIQAIIDKNPDLQGMINDLRKAKIKGSLNSARKHNKVIHLEDFLKGR